MQESALIETCNRIEVVLQQNRDAAAIDNQIISSLNENSKTDKGAKRHIQQSEIIEVDHNKRKKSSTLLQSETKFLIMEFFVKQKKEISVCFFERMMLLKI